MNNLFHKKRRKRKKRKCTIWKRKKEEEEEKVYHLKTVTHQTMTTVYSECVSRSAAPEFVYVNWTVIWATSESSMNPSMTSRIKGLEYYTTLFSLWVLFNGCWCHNGDYSSFWSPVSPHVSKDKKPANCIDFYRVVHNTYYWSAT